MNYRCEYCGQKFALDDVCCRFCGGRLPDVAPQRNEIDFWPDVVGASTLDIYYYKSTDTCRPIIYHEDTKLRPYAAMDEAVLIDWGP